MAFKEVKAEELQMNPFSKIGKDCIIYPNVTIREFCEIGDRVILQPGVVIGGDGSF